MRGAQEVEIVAPVPQSIEWHRLSRWRNAEELRAQYPTLWSLWKKQGLIPDKVIIRVELGEHERAEFSLD